MPSSRTRVTYGCTYSKDYIDLDSKWMLEAVIQLPPSENRVARDITTFCIPSDTPNGCFVEAEDTSGTTTIKLVKQSCSPETVSFQHQLSNKSESFNRVTIYRETVQENNTFLTPNSLFYQIDSITHRVASEQIFKDNVVKYEVASIWKCPSYSIEQPHKLIFQKHRGFVQFIVDGKWLSTEEVLQIIHSNLPQAFWPQDR